MADYFGGSSIPSPFGRSASTTLRRLTNASLNLPSRRTVLEISLETREIDSPRYHEQQPYYEKRGKKRGKRYFADHSRGSLDLLP